MASSSPSFFSAPQMHPPRDQETHRALLQDLRVTTTGKRAMSFSGIDNGEDELSDDSMQAGERKRRSLSKEQVRTLETSFEQGNKLEPEKKMQLAMALGLRPRQVAIWFQNRRARWKTKQLEKDYDALRRQLEAIKLENEALRAHNEKLQAETLALKGRYYNTSEPINLNKEIEASCSNPSENSSERTSMAMESSSFHPHRGLALLSSVRPAEMEMHCPKIEHYIAEGSFSNLLCSLEDHAATLWPWPDQHSFH